MFPGSDGPRARLRRVGDEGGHLSSSWFAVLVFSVTLSESLPSTSES